MKEKKVVLEIANMEGRYGIENYLMNMLRNFDFNKVKILFMSANPGPFDAEIESYGCEIFRVPPLGATLEKIRIHNQAFRKLLSEHPEIKTVHIHGNTAIGCIDARIAKQMGVKNIIVHSHNDGCSSLRSYLLHLIGRMLISKQVTQKLSCSKAASKWMFGRCKNTIVLKNAINLEKYRFAKDVSIALKKKFGMNGKKVIGHVGRIEKQKNHMFILEVFYHVHMVNPDTCLLLVGDGSLSKEVSRKSKELGLSDSVIHIKQSDCVNELLMAMDVFIFPSIWEGLGISLVEAQASGLNCIVSDVIKDEVCVTELIEKHSLSEGAEAWANVVSKKIIESQNIERSSEIYISELSKAGFDERKAANILQNIYMEDNS